MEKVCMKGINGHICLWCINVKVSVCDAYMKGICMGFIYMYEGNEKKHVGAMNAWKTKWKINVQEKYVICVGDMIIWIVCIHISLWVHYDADACDKIR